MKTGYFNIVKFLLFLLMFGGLMSCHQEVINPYEPHPILVKEIEVRNEYELGRLEVEIHITDAVTGRLLGCSGARQGLRAVDTVHVLYFVDADFVRPEGGLLYLEDIENREIEVWVIEDDEAECPGPFIPHEDDLIGISGPIPGYQLDGNIDLQFDDVLHLRLGT